eukprot:195179-Prymnesium_polylepis.1
MSKRNIPLSHTKLGPVPTAALSTAHETRTGAQGVPHDRRAHRPRRRVQDPRGRRFHLAATARAAL